MNITRDDNQFLIIETRNPTMWVMATVIGLLGPAAVVWFMYTMGSDWQAMLLVLFPIFTPFGLLFVYLTPISAFCFNRKKRKLLVRKRWPWGQKEEAIAFADFEGVSIAGGAKHLPLVTLKGGRKVFLTKLGQLDGQKASHIVERIGHFVNHSPPAGRTGALDKGTGPIAVAPTPKRTHPAVVIGVVVVTVGILYFAPTRGGGASRWERLTHQGEHQDQAATEARIQAKKARRAAKERETVMNQAAAAEKGDAEAMIFVARAYADGKGAPIDHEQALSYTRRAMAKNHRDGYTLMANFYAKGITGLPRNTKEAEKLYLKAADRGSAAALYGLSSLHYHNQGFPQDLARAHAYMVLCARGKYFNATTAVNIIGNKLSPPQRGASARLVADWDQKHPGLKITS